MNNRIWNARNPHQGDATRVLCVCSAGLLRSPTAAWVLSNPPFNFNTRAAGSSKTFALIPVDDVLLAWADVVLFVNKENEQEVRKEFDLSEKNVLTLNIPDNFAFRDPVLCNIITEQCKEGFLKLSQETDTVFFK